MANNAIHLSRLQMILHFIHSSLRPGDGSVRSLAATAYHFRTWVYYRYGRLTSEEHNLQMAYTKDLILEEFKLFSVPTGGIGRWLTKNTDEDVFNRLIGIENNPLPYVQLNQLLVLGH